MKLDKNKGRKKKSLKKKDAQIKKKLKSYLRYSKRIVVLYSKQ